MRGWVGWLSTQGRGGGGLKVKRSAGVYFKGL